MHLRVTITTPFLMQLRWQLVDAPGGVDFRGGIARDGQRLEVLLPGPRSADGADSVLVHAGLLDPRLVGISHLFPMRRPAGDGVRLDLWFREGRGCSAAIQLGGETHRVDEVLIAGPGMDCWHPGDEPAVLRGDVPRSGPFSRYMGALGGRAVHARLRSIPVLGIAAARLGSAMATALARAGCERLFLADPDVLEEHSQDAIECLPGVDLGSPKVIAVQRLLRQVAPWTEVVALPVRADAPETVAACRQSRLIFSAPDRDDARFAAALLAAAFHRVHIDVGSGVFDGETWRAGADVRLILPEQGCLCCIGGLDLQAVPPLDWRRQRAGSLRSLNHLAVSTAMLLLERLVVGELDVTTWMRLEIAANGTVSARQVPVARDPRCPLCARWAGAGDSALRPGARR